MCPLAGEGESLLVASFLTCYTCSLATGLGREPGLELRYSAPLELARKNASSSIGTVRGSGLMRWMFGSK